MKRILNWYQFLKKTSVGGRFAFYILVFSSIVTLVSTVLQLSIEYKKDVGMIYSQLDQVRDGYSKSLANSLWIISDEGVYLQLEGIAALPDIEYVEVVSEKNIILSRGANRSKQVINKSYPLIYVHNGKEFDLGELHIVATLDGVYTRLKAQVLLILLTQGVKTFLVSLFILYLFQILVGRHLATIAQFLDASNDKSLDQELKLERTQSKYTNDDELEQAVKAINQMRKSLKSYYSELAESEQNLNNAQKIAHIGSWQFNADTKEINWSAEVYRIYEMEPFSQDIGFDWFMSHLYGDDVVMVQDSVEKALNAQKKYDIKHRILTAEGNVKFVHQIAEVYWEDNIQKMSGTVQDITEFQYALEEISRLSQVVYQNPFSTIITDAEGVIKYVNKEAIDMSGYAEQELIGQKMNVFSSGLHTKEFFADLWNTIVLKQKMWRGTIINRMKDGSNIDCLSTIFPLFNDKHEVINFVTIQEDVTEQNIKDKLFMMQTRQAQMGEMLSMIAHQWRQPLSIISAIMNQQRVHIALDKYTLEGLEYSMNDIDIQVQYLSNTITDFRDFFKPDKEKTLTKSSVLISKALKLIGHALKNENVKIVEIQLKDESYQIYEHELVQVVLNLLKNAQDVFSDKKIKNPEISITINQINNMNIIIIEDNAQGIDASVIDTLFLPYVTTKSKKNGTGLGLYMSKTIVEEHCGGHLYVENTESGAKFTISFPLIKI